jgi:fibronectin-binding autotransporter adhesin
MAIRHKRKNSAGYTWQAGDLVEGQIGLNIADGTLHFDKADGSTVTIAPGAITEIVQDTTPQLAGNLDVQSNSITTSVTNGNITIAPNGTGDVLIDADTLRVGDSNAAATITSNGTGNLTLSTNNGTNSGTIVITQGANADIVITPNGTGDVDLIADTVQIGDANAAATLTTNGTGNLTLSTNNGTSSGTIAITQGVNGSISILPNGTGTVSFRGTGSTGSIDVGNRTIQNGNDAGITINTGSGLLVLNNGLTTNTIASGSSTQNIRLRGNNATGGFIEVSGAANGNILLSPDGTGDVHIDADTLRIGDANNPGTVTTNGTGNLTLHTNNGSNSGNIQITQGTGGNIDITPNGGGRVGLLTPTTSLGFGNNAATLTTTGTGNLTLNTNSGTNSGSIVINQGANANIVLTPNGTGETVINNLAYNESVFALGNSGTATLTPNAINGPVQTITATGNFTLSAFTSPVSGQTITFVITQDATGSRTLTSTMRFAGGSKTLSTAANSIDILTVSYIGTTYYASLAKGFV